ncbi:MAG TPA: TonB family protein [Candidatus Acidoferrum sp.]
MGRFVMIMLLASTLFLTTETAIPSNGDGVLAGGATPQAQANCALSMLSSAEEVDFRPYLRDVYAVVKKRWLANARPSLEKGEKGIDVVEFRIQKDGNVPKDLLTIKVGSGKSDLDAASLEAVREAAPFSKLPDKFAQAYIELRFTFYYNLQPNR